MQVILAVVRAFFTVLVYDYAHIIDFIADLNPSAKCHAVGAAPLPVRLLVDHNSIFNDGRNGCKRNRFISAHSVGDRTFSTAPCQGNVPKAKTGHFIAKGSKELRNLVNDVFPAGGKLRAVHSGKDAPLCNSISVFAKVIQ